MIEKCPIIVFVCTTMGWGGVENDTIQLATAYIKRGLNVYVIIDHEPLYRLGILEEAGIKHTVLNASDEWTAEQYKAALKDALPAEGNYLIHANIWERKEEVFQTANELRVPVFATLHTTIRPSWKHRLGLVGNRKAHFEMINLYNRENPIVLNISDESQRGLQVLCPKVSRSRRIYLGVDIPERPLDVSLANDAPNVIWVGSMIERKRPLLALEIWEKTIRQFPSAKLTMVGDGPQMSQVKDLAQTFPQGNVEITGAMRDWRHVKEKAHIMFCTSTHEGIPTVVLETMACGIPTVTTDAGAIEEAVLHGKSGLVSKRRDIASLTRNLSAMINDSYLRSQMGTISRLRAKEMFSLERYVMENMIAYEELGGIVVTR